MVEINGKDVGKTIEAKVLEDKELDIVEAFTDIIGEIVVV